MQKLIKLSNTHYIVIDDSKIKEGDLSYDKEGWPWKYCKKITHSTQPELLGTGWMQSVLPLFLSEVEEAINGYSVEKLAFEAMIDYKPFEEVEGYKDYAKHGYIKGFKAHQELTKDKLFTKKDMINSLKELSKQLFLKKEFSLSDSIEKSSKIIQSLHPKTEWDIEIDEQGKLKLL